jgi:hypothetical protein
MPEIFTGTIETPGLYPDIEESAYHADPVPEKLGGSLSSTGVKDLLPPSCPALFDWRRKHPKASTKSQELGTVVHGLVLGTGQPVEVLDYPDYNKKAAQQARDAAAAAGKVPMLAHKYAEAETIANAVKQHDTAGAIFAEGDPEVSMFGPDPETGIWRRGRLDWLTWIDGRPTVGDAKTTADVSPEHFAKSIAEFSYHVQEAHYRWLLADLLGCHPDNIDFMFVCVPTAPPYLTQIYRIHPSDVERGRGQCLAAYQKYRDCTETGTWPDWSQERDEEIGELSLPAYARIRIERQLEDHDISIPVY